jgi:phosphoglycolate phosphatase
MKQHQHPYTAVAFDLDGTLVDTVPDLAHAGNLMLQSLSMPAVTLEEVRLWIGDGIDVLTHRILCHNNPQPPEYGNELHVAASTTFKQFYFDNVCVHSQLYPNVLELVTKLHKSTLITAVITNKPRKFTLPLLQALKLDDLFDTIICGDDLPNKKPDPAQIQHFLTEQSLDASQLLMVGDSKNDLLSAQNAGCDQVFVSFGYHQGIDPADYKPRYIVDDFAELEFLLEEQDAAGS